VHDIEEFGKMRRACCCGQVILLVGGEHARELITSEIVFWLGKLLAGIDDELMDWAAIQSATASAWKRGWAKGTFREWADDLLKHVLFKVPCSAQPSAAASGHSVRAPCGLGCVLLVAVGPCCSWCGDTHCCAPWMQIIPIENIQGRKAVEGGDNCLRKTTAGVDLNRNWEFAWTAVRPAHAQTMCSWLALHALCLWSSLGPVGTLPQCMAACPAGAGTTAVEPGCQ
jgi:hypothetical protein